MNGLQRSAFRNDIVLKKSDGMPFNVVSEKIKSNHFVVIAAACT